MTMNTLKQHNQDISYVINLIEINRNHTFNNQDGQQVFDALLKQSINDHQYTVWKILSNIRIKYFTQKNHQFYNYENQNQIKAVYQANPHTDKLVKITVSTILQLLDQGFETTLFTQHYQPNN